MNRQNIQIEIGNLARVCSQNARGSGHYTPTPPLGASNGMILFAVVITRSIRFREDLPQHKQREILLL